MHIAGTAIIQPRQTRQAANLWRDSTGELVKSAQVAADGDAFGTYVNLLLT